MTSFLSQFDAFHDMAAQATGLTDFGSDDYREPMRLLLADYDKHSYFNQLGVEMISGEIVGRLVGRLMTEQGIKQNPASTNASITRPLVIIGMARTGTTALLRLMSQDPALQSLPLWLGCTPMPRPPRETWESNPCYQQVAQGLEQMYTLDPEIRVIHPMAAGEPDECRFALNHSYWAPDCSTTAIVPNYAEWVLNCDARYAYRYYRRVLNLIATGDSRRWLLKDVCHLFNLDAFLDVFPDACIVHTHRDPIVSTTSVASLIYHLRKLREDNLNPFDHGKLVLDTWTPALNRAEKVRRMRDPAQFFDVHNDEIQADPLGTVERIYRYFNLPVSDAARAAWRQRTHENPKSGHGAHHYKPEDFGFTPALVNDAMGEYYTRYKSVEKQPVSKR
jgi:Sulfotransferase family